MLIFIMYIHIFKLICLFGRFLVQHYCSESNFAVGIETIVFYPYSSLAYDFKYLLSIELI